LPRLTTTPRSVDRVTPISWFGFWTVVVSWSPANTVHCCGSRAVAFGRRSGRRRSGASPPIDADVLHPNFTVSPPLSITKIRVGGGAEGTAAFDLSADSPAVAAVLAPADEEEVPAPAAFFPASDDAGLLFLFFLGGDDVVVVGAVAVASVSFLAVGDFGAFFVGALAGDCFRFLVGEDDGGGFGTAPEPSADSSFFGIAAAVSAADVTSACFRFFPPVPPVAIFFFLAAAPFVGDVVFFSGELLSPAAAAASPVGVVISLPLETARPPSALPFPSVEQLGFGCLRQLQLWLG